MTATREALSDILLFVAMVLGALAVDAALHLLDRPDWGRMLGYIGTTLIVVSFAHSARKRKMIKTGPAPLFLRFHEFLAWVGALMVIVHGGIHFNAPLPWMALIAMLVTVASGLTGKYLLKKSKMTVAERKKGLAGEGLSDIEMAERLYLDSLVVEAMKKWRKVHIPITATFGLLAVLHVISALAFWRW